MQLSEFKMKTHVTKMRQLVVMLKSECRLRNDLGVSSLFRKPLSLQHLYANRNFRYNRIRGFLFLPYLPKPSHIFQKTYLASGDFVKDKSSNFKNCQIFFRNLHQ
jgi:hypothetical protein